MKSKTLLIVLTIISILFICNFSYATNDMKNGIHNVTDTAVDGTERLANDVKNGIGKASGAIEEGARDLGNTVSNGAQNIGNAVSDGMNGMENAENTGNTAYTATRTTASDVTDTDIMNTNLWTWVALAIAGIVIVGLVWYYATEHNIDR